MLHNQLRLDDCRVACAALPQNGFMLFRQPKPTETIFERDHFDNDVRRPLVQFINWINEMYPPAQAHDEDVMHQPEVMIDLDDLAAMDVVMQPPDVIWREFDIHLMIDMDDVMQPPVD